MSNHISSMRAMSMDMAVSQSDLVQGNVADHSTSSCCDAIAPFVLTCDFMTCQSACIPEYEGGERVAYLVPIVQSIYIRTLAPPPKA
jgi:hypothetical protein